MRQNRSAGSANSADPADLEIAKSGLRALSLAGNAEIPASTLGAFLSTAFSLSGFWELDLSSCCLDDARADAIVDSIKNSHSRKDLTLKQLNLSGNHEISDKKLSDLVSLLIQVGSMSDLLLRDLRLSEARASCLNRSILLGQQLNILERLSLTKIDISGSDIPAGGLEELLKSLFFGENLTSLIMENIRLSKDKCAVIQSCFLRNNYLRELSLSDNDAMTPALLCTIAKQFLAKKSFDSLRLRNSQLDDELLKAFADGAQQLLLRPNDRLHLRKLDLSRNAHFGGAALEQILSLLFCRSALEYLSLGGCELHSGKTDSLLCSVKKARGDGAHCALTTLILDENILASDRVCEQLAEIVVGLGSLRCFSIRTCGLDDARARIILRGLEKAAPSLAELDLSGNLDISAAGWGEAACICFKMEKLESLLLGSCQFNVKKISAFLAGMQRGRSQTGRTQKMVKRLDLSGSGQIAADRLRALVESVIWGRAEF